MPSLLNRTAPAPCSGRRDLLSREIRRRILTAVASDDLLVEHLALKGRGPHEAAADGAVAGAGHPVFADWCPDSFSPGWRASVRPVPAFFRLVLARQAWDRSDRGALVSAWEEIERARSQQLVDEDGNPVELATWPPLTEQEIAALAERVGTALPDELVQLVRRCCGLDGVLEQVDFSGRTIDGFEFAEIFPHGLSIAHDGFGNFWVLDLTPGAVETAPVYFACHDAPVVLYQSPNLAHFVHELVRMNVPPHESAVVDVHEDRLFDVWRKNPGAITRAAALASTDHELQAFANTLDENFTLIDLRDPEVGMGFSWGRHGPQTIVRRHGTLPIFAYSAPKTRSLWARLTGRG